MSANLSFIEYIFICLLMAGWGLLIGYIVWGNQETQTIQEPKTIYVITDSLYKSNEAKQDSLINKLNQEVFIGCGVKKELTK